MMRIQWSAASCWGMLLLTTLGAGCQQMNLFHRNPVKQAPVATEKNPAVEIVCLWEAAEGTGLNGLPCRGFAGQIFFFTRDRAEPVKVDGDLCVFVFDDKGTQGEQEKPIHEFNFDAGSFQKFIRPTNLGFAYQLFVPYTRPGNERAKCSLRVRMTPRFGNPVYSKPAAIAVSGTTPRQGEPKGSEIASSAKSGGIQQASHEVVGDLVPAKSQSLVPEGILMNSDEMAPGVHLARNRLRSRLLELEAAAAQSPERSLPDSTAAPSPGTSRLKMAASASNPEKVEKEQPREALPPVSRNVRASEILEESPSKPASRHPLFED